MRYNDFTFPKFEAVERLCVTLSIKRGCQPPHISGKVLLGIELPSGAKRQSEMGKRLEGKIVRDKIRSVSEFKIFEHGTKTERAAKENGN